jgi:hypothetical protein
MHINFDGMVKSPIIVMPDTGSSPVQALIRHPEPIESTGFWLCKNDEKIKKQNFYDFVNFQDFKNACLVMIFFVL